MKMFLSVSERMTGAATQFKMLLRFYAVERRFHTLKIQLFFFLHLYKIFILYEEKGCPHSG
jgi:hypothetical protein